jgi:hypothetical protein
VAAAAAQVKKSAIEDLLDLDFSSETAPPPASTTPATSHQAILDLFDAPAPGALVPVSQPPVPPITQTTTTSNSAIDDLLGVFGDVPSSSQPSQTSTTAAKPDKSDPFADLLS